MMRFFQTDRSSHHDRTCWFWQPEKPHHIATLWFNEVVNDHPKYIYFALFFLDTMNVFYFAVSLLVFGWHDDGAAHVYLCIIDYFHIMGNHVQLCIQNSLKIAMSLLFILLVWSFTTSLNRKVMIWWGFFRLTAPAAMPACIGAESLKKPHQIATLRFSEVVNDHAK